MKCFIPPGVLKTNIFRISTFQKFSSLTSYVWYSVQYSGSQSGEWDTLEGSQESKLNLWPQDDNFSVIFALFLPNTVWYYLLFKIQRSKKVKFNLPMNCSQLTDMHTVCERL